MHCYQSRPSDFRGFFHENYEEPCKEQSCPPEDDSRVTTPNLVISAFSFTRTRSIQSPMTRSSGSRREASVFSVPSQVVNRMKSAVTCHSHGPRCQCFLKIPIVETYFTTSLKQLAPSSGNVEFNGGIVPIFS
ncbi:hypothetical protein NL676_030682 [Syzygium grande]|nr:hypothetical protein NL676_030682 [Syzygium grande]